MINQGLELVHRLYTILHELSNIFEKKKQDITMDFLEHETSLHSVVCKTLATRPLTAVVSSL